jgi:DNA anti-recombination protein RmuC
MKDLAEMLEEELSEAVEVKNPKSLHRYITLLTGGYVEQEAHELRYSELSSSLREMLASMQEGFRRMDDRFRRMDDRFEALQKQMDERFTAMQKQMDERFNAQERRFDHQHKLISLGFTALALIITAFNLAIILG